MSRINAATIRVECEELVAAAREERDLYDALHEAVDGHEWVIYTASAYEVCAALCPDWAEFQSEYGSPPSSIEQLAFFALMQRCQELI
jgi:hypothetical protein